MGNSAKVQDGKVGVKSMTSCMTSICVALDHLKEEIGTLDGCGSLVWNAINNPQRVFDEDYLSKLKNILKICKGFVKGKSSTSAEVLNAYLKENGYGKIQLEEMGPDEVGAVGILDVLAKWRTPGKEVQRISNYDGGEYDYAELKDCRIFASPHDKNLLAIIPTQTDFDVVISVCNQPVDQFDLMNIVAGKISDTISTENCYDGIIFPMVFMEETADISWLCGMETQGKDSPWVINQALQLNRLRMNHIGARAQSAVAVGVFRMAAMIRPKQFLIIDEPFAVGIVHKELQMPIFAAYVCPDSWKNPGDISKD